MASLVSVIIPIYNEPLEWIKEAITSIQNQTYKNLEIIIVNDNPIRFENINLVNDIKQHDSRIRIINNSVNIGLAASLNKAIDVAKGEYIARMDADDISLPQRITEQIKFLEENPKIGICGTYAKTINSKEKLGRQLSLQHKDKDLKNAIYFFCPFVHPTVICRKKILSENKYDENCRIGQDWELWKRVANKTDFANIPKILLFYRIHDNQAPKKAGIQKTRESKLYSSSKEADEIGLYGAIRELYIKFRCEDSLTKVQLDRLFSHLSKLNIFSDSYKYLIGIYARLMSQYGILNLFSNKLIKDCPFRYIVAIISEYSRSLSARLKF